MWHLSNGCAQSATKNALETARKTGFFGASHRLLKPTKKPVFRAVSSTLFVAFCGIFHTAARKNATKNVPETARKTGFFGASYRLLKPTTKPVFRAVSSTLFVAFCGIFQKAARKMPRKVCYIPPERQVLLAPHTACRNQQKNMSFGRSLAHFSWLCATSFKRLRAKCHEKCARDRSKHMFFWCLIPFVETNKKKHVFRAVSSTLFVAYCGIFQTVARKMPRKLC